MPDPPSKKQKPSLVKVSGKDKYSTHEHVDIVVVKSAESASEAAIWGYNITCFPPEFQNPVPGALRKATAVQNVI